MIIPTSFITFRALPGTWNGFQSTHAPNDLATVSPGPMLTYAEVSDLAGVAVSESTPSQVLLGATDSGHLFMEETYRAWGGNSVTQATWIIPMETGASYEVVATSSEDGVQATITVSGPSGIWSYDLVLADSEFSVYIVPMEFIPPEPEPVDVSRAIALDLDLLDYTWYADIRARGITSRIPTRLYVDEDYPQRTARLWPVPNVAGSVELWLWRPIDVQADLDQELNLPPGYDRALIYSLAEALSMEYGRPVPASVSTLARSSLSQIQGLNAMNKPEPVKDSRLPNKTGRAGFNWITGRSGPDNWNV